MSEPLLKARDLHKSYRIGSQDIPVLTGLELDLARGESVAVIGASGVGKSTLLHVLGLLDTPDRGEIYCGGTEVSSLPPALLAEWRNRTFGFVFQFYHLIPELNAVENTILPVMMDRETAGGASSRRELRSLATSILEELGLGERLKHRPNQLSGGERQRVAIARALMNAPEILFCDEPTGNLDPRTTAGVEEALWAVRHRRDQTMLLVTHDERLARRADRVLRMSEGVLEETRPEPVDDAAVPAPVPVPVELASSEAREVRQVPPVEVLLSFEGRIGRAGYWLIRLMLYGFAFCANLAIAELMPDSARGITRILGLYLAVAIQWPVWAIVVKRCHDRGRSGLFYFHRLGIVLLCGFTGGMLWLFTGTGTAFGVLSYLLVGVCALVGLGAALWNLIELGFLPGTRGSNTFGPRPGRTPYGWRPPVRDTRAPLRV